MIECPSCNQKAVSLCRDEIKTYHTFIDKNGSIKVGKKVIYSNELDNCWLECNNCHITSDDNDELDEMLDVIDW